MNYCLWWCSGRQFTLEILHVKPLSPIGGSTTANWHVWVVAALCMGCTTAISAPILQCILDCDIPVQMLRPHAKLQIIMYTLDSHNIHTMAVQIQKCPCETVYALP